MNFLVCGKKNQSIEIKKDIQNIVFSNHIEYDVKSKTYRTPYENEVLSMMVRVSDKIKTGSKGVKPLNSRLVHTPLQLSNLFMQDLDKLRAFTQRLKMVLKAPY